MAAATFPPSLSTSEDCAHPHYLPSWCVPDLLHSPDETWWISPGVDGACLEQVKQTMDLPALGIKEPVVLMCGAYQGPEAFIVFEDVATPAAFSPSNSLKVSPAPAPADSPSSGVQGDVATPNSTPAVIVSTDTSPLSSVGSSPVSETSSSVIIVAANNGPMPFDWNMDGGFTPVNEPLTAPVANMGTPSTPSKNGEVNTPTSGSQPTPTPAMVAHHGTLYIHLTLFSHEILLKICGQSRGEVLNAIYENGPGDSFTSSSAHIWAKRIGSVRPPRPGAGERGTVFVNENDGRHKVKWMGANVKEFVDGMTFASYEGQLPTPPSTSQLLPVPFAPADLQSGQSMGPALQPDLFDPAAVLVDMALGKDQSKEAAEAALALMEMSQCKGKDSETGSAASSDATVSVDGDGDTNMDGGVLESVESVKSEPLPERQRWLDVVLNKPQSI